MGEDIILFLLFFLIAAIYSSAGFGGGSSYLAVLSLFAVDPENMRAIALVCNIIVVGGALFNFQRNGFVRWKEFIPLIVLSVPFAFVGGLLSLPSKYFLVILAVLLLTAATLMLVKKYRPKEKNGIQPIKIASTGGLIGFVSGLVGIGGGIFFSPVLHLWNWSSPKVIAAASSFFILVNSAAAFAGVMLGGQGVEFSKIAFLGIAVLLGGQVGNRLTIFKFDEQLVRRLTAVIIAFVGLRILFQLIW